MSKETFEFVNGAQSFRIQFDIATPAAAAFQHPGPAWGYMPTLRYTVANIRITEITADVGDKGPRKNLEFGRSFDSPAKARSGARDHAKRIVREQMMRRPA